MIGLDLVGKGTILEGPVVNGRVAAEGHVQRVVRQKLVTVVLNLVRVRQARKVVRAAHNGDDQADDGA